jgi:hypothetical protein
VRPRDADLILGQGSVNSGWHAHKLTKPGEFLISSPEHAMPERNRAYLLTDARRDYYAAHCAPLPPSADADPAFVPETASEPPETAEGLSLGGDGDGHPRPETALWNALVDADPAGVSAAELEAACGMGRSWVYYRLQAHATAGRAVQVRRGYWRAARPSDGPAGAAGRRPAPHRAGRRAGRVGIPRPVAVSNGLCSSTRLAPTRVGHTPAVDMDVDDYEP